jgi:hypothetical protein
LRQDAEPLIWTVSAGSIDRMFGFDASTVTIVQLVSIELTPARALSVAVEARDVDLYETLSQARLLAVCRYGGTDRKGDRPNESDVRGSCSLGSGRSASPQSQRSASPRSRQRA